jgi:hypothetical protein
MCTKIEMLLLSLHDFCKLFKFSVTSQIVSCFKICHGSTPSLVDESQLFSPPLSSVNKGWEILRIREIIYREVSC